MPVRYAALRSQYAAAAEADQALNDAFESDNEADIESTPLTSNQHENANDGGAPRQEVSSRIPGAYDFERDYDYPPPGSPPHPSAFALPNDIGNTNGLLPSSPVGTTVPRPSFFRRAVGAILPTHYTRVPTEPSQSSAGRVGGGIENDGVFANVVAKPQPARVVRTENGDIHLAPEETQKEAPPSYVDAQADAVPPYWENTVHAPAGLDATGDMIIDDLPSGSIWMFFLNGFISFFFQFIGFLLTYVLHTSHAAKYGSRAGLGLTLIQYGFYSRSISIVDSAAGEGQETTGITRRDDSLLSTSPPSGEDVMNMPVVTPRDWLSFLLMTLGWFLLLSSIIGFWRIKRWERALRISSILTPVTADAVERDIAVRRNLQTVFGFGFPEEPPNSNPPADLSVRSDENGHIIVLPTQDMLEEARLARDLRAAGLI